MAQMLCWKKEILLILVISLNIDDTDCRGRRQMIKTCTSSELEMLSNMSPVMTIHHSKRQGRGAIVRGIEHIQSDLHQMGVLVKKIEDPILPSSYIDIIYKGKQFQFSGDICNQEDVLRWAVQTVHCHKDIIEEITESQLNVLKRHFPSFSVIYNYPTSSTQQLKDKLGGVDNICSRTGDTLLFLCDGDLAPLHLYLPLDKSPVLVLYAHNIPLVYTGVAEPETMMTWLSETHDTSTNMIKLSSRHLHKIIALERTVFVLFLSRSDDTLQLVQSSSSSSRLDRLGVVAVTVDDIAEVEGLGVAQLPALVMFKHGLPIVYTGHLGTDNIDNVDDY